MAKTPAWFLEGQLVGDGAFSHKIDHVAIFYEILNLEGDLRSKSYGNLAEWVDFAYWWSFSGGGSSYFC